MWQNAQAMMDDSTPASFLQSLRTDLLRRRVGFVTLAVLFALACLQFVNNLVWYLVLPILRRILSKSGSVIFDDRALEFPTEALIASVLQFALAIIAVYYLNRWLVGRRAAVRADEAEVLEEQEPELDPSLNVALGDLADDANRLEQTKASAAAEAPRT